VARISTNFVSVTVPCGCCSQGSHRNLHSMLCSRIIFCLAWQSFRHLFQAHQLVINNFFTFPYYHKCLLLNSLTYPCLHKGLTSFLQLWLIAVYMREIKHRKGNQCAHMHTWRCFSSLLKETYKQHISNLPFMLRDFETKQHPPKKKNSQKFVLLPIPSKFEEQSQILVLFAT